ncbi:MAG: GGDEF domain-containing protein [Chitinispirillales bacterium]|jgi:GGDEF domain-containing protein|nr:GGDEF domain-containing protein [Chitinispirillales bacterium]
MLSAELDFAENALAEAEEFDVSFAGNKFTATTAGPARHGSTRFVEHREIEELLNSVEYEVADIDREAGIAGKGAEERAGVKPYGAAGEKGAPGKQYSECVRVSLFPAIGKLAKPGDIFPPDKSVEAIYDALNRDKAVTEFTVVDGATPRGFMTRSMINELLGGRYGFWLNAKKRIGEVVSDDFLKVDRRMPIDYVTKLAMQRPQECLYNPIVVIDEEGYYGVVTIKDLLDAYSKVEVEAAISANPLTKLPGNLIIEGEITRRIFGQGPYCIIYIDIDNFKAYNDAYGFENGDLILKFTADTIKDSVSNGEFVGHIGGDDFIIICDYHDGSEICREIIRRFAAGVNSFYRDVDLENGFIISTNRHGVVDSFPIASLSIAGISNKSTGSLHINAFSKAIAHLKKKCKKRAGNYFEII